MMRILILLMMIAPIAAMGEGKMVNRIYADRTARDIGDLVTVKIEEQSSHKKDAADDRDKSLGGNLDFNFPGMQANGNNMWNALKLPEWSIDASKNYSSSGSKAKSDQFSAEITVHITERLPNGNLMILGERMVNIDGDIIKFTLSGMIRPDDISRANMILSSKIAGATISYETLGEFSRNQRKGILSRIVDWIIPF